jgi:hypothetical protein
MCEELLSRDVFEQILVEISFSLEFIIAIARFLGRNAIQQLGVFRLNFLLNFLS